MRPIWTAASGFSNRREWTCPSASSSVTAKVDTGLALIRAEGATECADALAAPTGGGE